MATADQGAILRTCIMCGGMLGKSTAIWIPTHASAVSKEVTPCEIACPTIATACSSVGIPVRFAAPYGKPSWTVPNANPAMF